MADKTKFDDTVSPLGGEPSDLDPFAELKRIMGLDRQEPVSQKATTAPVSDDAFLESLSKVEPDAAPVAAKVHAEVARQIEAQKPSEELADDFGIDLERELMGEFAAAEAPASEPVATVSMKAEVAAEDTAELDAAFAEDFSSLETAFRDQPQSHAELDADLEELNVVFAESEDEEDDEALPELELDADDFAEEDPVAVVAVAQPQQPSASDDADELDFSDLDFGDIDSAIAKEMDQALSASFAAETVAEVPATPAKAAETLADVDMDFDNALDWSALDSPRTEVKSASATRVSALDNADELLAALEAAAKNTTSEPGVAEAKSAASTEDPFATLAKMSDQYQSRGNQYDWRQPVRSTQPRAAAPEVETTEMFDQAFSMTDDLDLPEVRYDEPTHAASEIDLEFDNLLNEMSRAEPVRPVRAAPEAPRYEQREPVAPRASDGFDDFDSVFAQPAPRAAQPPHRAAPQPQQNYQPQDDSDLGDFDFDDQDFDDQEPVQQSAYRGHDNRGRGGRGMMIAAIVGGVALLGGIGAMAMSWNGDIGAPALVKADNSPTKIRPENPGGSSVPNQDSAVYDTVSRSGAAQPAQERLVSATEDPIALPQPDDSETDELASLAKGEDRVAPEADASAPSEDPLAVAPRKVRTMIVKPDGSLVPADEPAAAAPAEPSVEDIASDPVGEPEQITTGATQPSPAVEPEAKTVAAVAPTPGGWAVQIASQPSEDGANKSMKSMTQKYSGVIGDRGAHIVKADVPGKGTYWRVRVAANSRDDAVSLCSNLKSAGGSCFVTR